MWLNHKLEKKFLKKLFLMHHHLMEAQVKLKSDIIVLL